MCVCLAVLSPSPSPPLPPSLLETVFLSNPELLNILGWLGGQWTPGILWSLPLQPWDYKPHTAFFFFKKKTLGSGTQIMSPRLHSSPFPTELSFQAGPLLWLHQKAPQNPLSHIEFGTILLFNVIIKIKLKRKWNPHPLYQPNCLHSSLKLCFWIVH